MEHEVETTTVTVPIMMNQSRSQELVGNNDDLITEILLRLPVKSLIRFKSVSQRWFSLISDPRFSEIRRRRNSYYISGVLFEKISFFTNPEHNLVSFDRNDTISFSNSFRKTTDVQILDSCNGLLCFYCIDHFCKGDRDSHCICGSRPGFSSNCSIVIYNPTTKQKTKLTQPRSRGISMTLAYDPCKSSHYKVVFVVTTYDNYQITIYSSQTRTWEISVDSFPKNTVDFHHGVFWNGVIHWISLEDNSLCFDVDRESLRQMPMPPIRQSCSPSLTHFHSALKRCEYFGAFGGNMHLIERKSSSAMHFNVFQMENDYSKWFMKYSINLDSVVASYPEMLDHFGFSVLGLIERDEGEEEGSILVLHIPGKAISYNLKDKTFDKICDISHHVVEWYKVFQFVETFSYV